MTFEEFFKRKKINLALLQMDEPALFTEFKNHYEQMGEKSFDHTKKYWFNQLRRRFPAPVEVKLEKVKIENQLAEQTIADSLTEPATPELSVGFKPRFKAAMVTKPEEEKTNPESPKDETVIEITPKPAGFKPRFKAGMVNKSAEEKAEPEVKDALPEEKPAEAPKPAGFIPRFKAGMVSKPMQDNTGTEIKETLPEEKPVNEAPKPVVFKPRFKPKSE